MKDLGFTNKLSPEAKAQNVILYHKLVGRTDEPSDVIFHFKVRLERGRWPILMFVT